MQSELLFCLLSPFLRTDLADPKCASLKRAEIETIQVLDRQVEYGQENVELLKFKSTKSFNLADFYIEVKSLGENFEFDVDVFAGGNLLSSFDVQTDRIEQINQDLSLPANQEVSFRARLIPPNLTSEFEIQMLFWFNQQSPLKAVIYNGKPVSETNPVNGGYVFITRPRPDGPLVDVINLTLTHGTAQIGESLDALSFRMFADQPFQIYSFDICLVGPVSDNVTWVFPDEVTDSIHNINTSWIRMDFTDEQPIIIDEPFADVSNIITVSFDAWPGDQIQISLCGYHMEWRGEYEGISLEISNYPVGDLINVVE